MQTSLTTRLTSCLLAAGVLLVMVSCGGGGDGSAGESQPSLTSAAVGAKVGKKPTTTAPATSTTSQASSTTTVTSSSVAAVTSTTLAPGAAVNVVALENAKPGTVAWQLDSPATGREIEGYASATSVNRGGSIDLMVNTAAPSFNVEIFRMGYYGGAGARLLRSYANLPGKAQPVPCANPAGVIECNWSVSLSVPIPAGDVGPASMDYWASGVYLAKLSTNAAPRKDSYIIFVVRDDARAATYVSNLPVTTYQAYNFWGGKSLYTGCDVQDRYRGWSCLDGSAPAKMVSFNRPYGKGNNPLSAVGLGAGEFLTNVQPGQADGYDISNAGWDYNMVRWMEKNGYDVKYVTNLDLHEDAGIFALARAFISTGHDEYYSKPMWDRLVAARDAGINLAFFSANQVFWQVRFADGSFGTAKKNRIMICYRGGGDPVKDNNLTTDQFRWLGRPEASLIGNQYVVDPIVGNVTITDAAHWLFAGSGAFNGAVLPGLLGYEINAYVPGISPPQTKLLARSTVNGYTGDITFYVDASSAQVFATGTMQWVWGLDNYIPNGLRADYTSPIAQIMTANLFDAIAEKNLHSFTNVASRLDLSTPASLDPAQTVQNAKPAGILKNNQWRLVPTAATNVYHIVSRANGMCLDAYGIDNGVPAGTWDCHGGNHQKWSLVNAGDGSLALIEQRTGRCLTVPGGSTAAGAGLTIANCDYSPNQLWRRAAL